MGFSKEQLRQRIERFTSWMERQEGFTCQKIDDQERGKHPYIVSDGSELAMVIFRSTGGVQLTAPVGTLKERILAWVAGEVCPFYDSSALGNLAKLDPFRYLLKQEGNAHDPKTFPPADALLLTKEDNPLVELAELVGYDVYLLAPAFASARYGIATQQEVVMRGNHLAQMLVQLLTGRPVAISEESASNHLKRKINLPTHVKRPLSYWRKHTQLHGTWLTQHTLAQMAGLGASTVRRIELETREAEHTHVYLSTARRILAVLNEIRELQDLPLIQMWNVDWTPKERDDAYL